MKLEKFEVSAVIPATPARVYEAWLSGDDHAAFTGAPATCEPVIGGRFTAWDGYIEGRNLDLEPGQRIIQSWRSTEFPEGSPDSQLEVILVSAGTDGQSAHVTIIHSGIPEGQGAQYHQGWSDHYFKPMLAFFEKDKKPVAAEKPAKKAAEKPAPKVAEPVKKAAAKPVNKAAAKPVKKATKPAKKAAAKPVKKAAKPVKKAAAKPVKKAAKPVKKAAAKPVKKAAKPVKKAAPKPVKKAAKAKAKTKRK